VVRDVINIAVDELKLHRTAVINHIVEFEVDSALIDSFKNNKDQWANHIKQALDFDELMASNRPQ